MKKIFALVHTLLLLSGSGYCQSAETLKVRQYRVAHVNDIMGEFVSFLSIPNVAIDTLNLRKNAVFIMDMMKKRNIRDSTTFISRDSRGSTFCIWRSESTRSETNIDILRSL